MLNYLNQYTSNVAKQPVSSTAGMGPVEGPGLPPPGGAVMDPTMMSGIPTVSGVGFQDAYNSVMANLGVQSGRIDQAADDVFKLVGDLSAQNIDYFKSMFGQAQAKFPQFVKQGWEAGNKLANTDSNTAMTQLLQSLSPQYAGLANTSSEDFANNLLKSLTNTSNGAVAPLMQNQLDSLMKYGRMGIEGSAAAKGMLDSGGTLKNLQDYGMGVAGQYLIPSMNNAINQGMASGNNQANNIWGSLKDLNSIYGTGQQSLLGQLNAGLSAAQTQAQLYQQQATAVGNQRNLQMEGQGNSIMAKANGLNQSDQQYNQMLMQMSSMPYMSGGGGGINVGEAAGTMGGAMGALGLMTLLL